MFDLNHKKQKEKLLTLDKSLNEEQYIFYNQNQEHVLKYELEIVLSMNINRKFCILIDSKSTIGYLSIKICDSIGQFPDFANLEGLKASNIQKKTERGLQLIPQTSHEIKDILENGNTIFCDILTNEYWVYTSINLSSKTKRLSVSLDLKLNVKLSIHKLKLLLLKAGMYFWMENCQYNDEFHYIYDSANCKTTKSKQNLDFEISDLTAKILLDELTIGDVFDFNSVITCNLKVSTIEEIFFEEIKAKYDSEKSQNKLKFEEMKNLTFEEFCTHKKFEEEFLKLKQLTRKLIKKVNKTEKLRNKIYCFNKSNINTTDYDEISDELLINPSLIIILPSKLARSNIKQKSMPSDISNGINIENNEPKSINSRKVSINNTNDDSKNSKQIIKLNNNLSYINKELEDAGNRDSIFSLHEDQSSIQSKLFSNHSGQAKNDDDKNAIELNKNNDDQESELLDCSKVQTEKINFTEMIKNKILKINSSPITSDFINYFEVDKFSEFIDAFMKIKIFKFSLENIKIPPFRNVTKNSFDQVKLTKKNTIISNMNPIIRTKNGFLIVIGLLILIGILLFVFVIILLTRL